MRVADHALLMMVVKQEDGTDKTAQRFPEISRGFFPVHKCKQREKIELRSVTSQVCMCSLNCLEQH